MSKVVYNGIELGYVKTTQYSNRSVADKDKPDLVYRETTLQVESVLAASVTPAVGAETAQDVLNRVRHELELPRRSLVYEVGGTRLIDLPNGDDANGPFPFGVDVQLVAEASFVIRWGVVFRVAECNGSQRQILSHRWTETASIDDEHLTTYRRSGRLIVSGRSGLNPDSFRGIVTPPIGPKFTRQSAEYTLHDNGLELAFAFVDKEQYVMPPYPAIKMSGYQAETTTNHTGAVRHGRLQISLTGPPDAPKQDLLRKCIEIGMSRAMAAGLRRGANGRYIVGGGITERLEKNTVELTLTWLMRPEGTQLANGGIAAELISRTSLLGVTANAIGATSPPVPNDPAVINGRNQAISALAMRGGWVGLPLPGTNSSKGIAPPTKGDVAWLQLVAAGLRDPCLTETFSTQLSNNQGVPTQFVPAIVRQAPSLPPETLGGVYSDPATDSVYDLYRAVCHYTHDEGVDVAASMKAGTAGKKFRLSGESMCLEVEYSARRAGRPPIVPDAKSPSKDPNWIYLSGTVSADNVDVAGDGVTLIYSVSGVLRFKALDPCKVNVVSPVPPYLSMTVEDEARLAAALTSESIVFLNGPSAGQKINPFCGYTTELRNVPGLDIGFAAGGFGVGQGSGYGSVLTAG